MVKNPPAKAGDLRDAGLIPGLERFPGGRNGNPLQYSPGEFHEQRSLDWWPATMRVRGEESISDMLVSWKAVAIDAVDLHRGLTGLDIHFGYSECIQNCC